MVISLDGVKMNVVETASNGVVNQHTIFKFRQQGEVVTSEYSGGEVAAGFLVGKMEGGKLEFSYCQLQKNGVLDNGISSCEVSAAQNGKIRLIERFEWKSRPGEKGINVFQEL